MQRAAAAAVRAPVSIEWRPRFDGVHGDRGDRLMIRLPAGESKASREEARLRLVQALDRVATSNRLTRDEDNAAGVESEIVYRRDGLLTQSVKIEIAAPSAEAGPSAPFPQKSGEPRLAIVLDDLGGDRSAAESIFALKFPLTLSVLPNHAHSEEIAEEARRRGYQVMLHLPMQSVGKEKPEQEELRPGMPAERVAALVDGFVKAVPGAIGVNNHQGSQSTADAELMSELMPVLREDHLFYIDSRTTAATLAFDSAERAGVRCAFRNVPFLDDVPEVGAVRKQLLLALAGARDKGEAIAIGHPHAATLQALREVLPEAKSKGVRLVFASELAH